MDIFQLLETLQSQAKVITVQVHNQTDYVSYFLTLAPSVVAILALVFSAWQFRISILNQLKLAQINAKIVTDIELKKEWCRDVRRLCIQCLTYGTDSHTAAQRMKFIANKHKEGQVFDHEKYQKYSDEQNNNFYKMLEAKSLLSLYIDPIEYEDFLKTLNKFTSVASNSECVPKEVGDARGTCIAKCREIIFKMNNEISQIAAEI